MAINSVKNLLIQALKPGRFMVMAKKACRRFTDNGGRRSDAENLKWIQAHCTDFKELAVSLDAALWEETEKVSKIFECKAEAILQSLEVKLGGGGMYPFLYFITRYVTPDCVVETGVAAGFSSYSFLAALRKNGKGKLHSSDFPYFRLDNPEKYIGIVVEESLKANWELLIEGDDRNLPRILKHVSKIDIFHYDSDKSYSGRKSAMALVEGTLGEDAIILMDDIQDNSYFYDYVEENSPANWCAFEFQGKYVGMIGQMVRRQV